MDASHSDLSVVWAHDPENRKMEGAPHRSEEGRIAQSLRELLGKTIENYEELQVRVVLDSTSITCTLFLLLEWIEQVTFSICGNPLIHATKKINNVQEACLK